MFSISFHHLAVLNLVDDSDIDCDNQIKKNLVYLCKYLFF